MFDKCEAIAILCSDLHLQHNPPVARSAEPDWFAAMARPLRQVRALQRECDCPVLCAGDVFDKWNAPPEVINFAIKELPPRLYAIPGQHDLPYHDYNDIKRSAYWTLVEAGVLNDLRSGCRHLIPDTDIMVTPFPWGVSLAPLDTEEFADHPELVHVALIHRYVWKVDCGYTGAPKEAKLGAYKAALRGYHAAVFGDNHKGFHVKRMGLDVLNCGGFMRRKIDEVDYQPHVGLLFEDGSIQRHPLTTKGEVLTDRLTLPPKGAVLEGMDDFVAQLGGLRGESLDFKEAVTNYMKANDVAKPVQRLLLDAME